MHVRVSLYVLLSLAVCVSAKCNIPRDLRGHHYLVNHFFDRIPGEELIIRTHYVEIVQDGQTQQLDCIDSQYSDILLRTSDGTGILCLQLPQIMDVPAEFQVRRRNVEAPDGALFTPSPIGSDVIPTIENQCTVYINSDVYTSRTRPGCNFPVDLQKTWTYSRGPLSEITFTNTSAMITLRDGNNFTGECERHDTDRNAVHRIALRTSLDADHDGVMCLVLRPLSGGKLLSQQANNGDRYMNLVKTIFFMEPIYLYETCDLIDEPLEGAVMQATWES
ncbi:uncharacterized protein LOC117328667 [Pecten maximus]|uniref:uncharacterized protein LOC117328667 n=1 Tax=Pecten maximus TaxID=6579 RepID=UPI0014582F1E|nr:uncharacterized protein LOC117328667 [Pecten maximus]